MAEPIGPKLHEPREGLWMIQALKIRLQQKSIFIEFKKSTKIFCLSLFYNVSKQRENMFTVEIEDGHEAPWKSSITCINGVV